MMKKLVVFDGPDRVGKTTTLQQLAKDLNATIHNSPSRTNSVKFLREITREDKSINAFTRQALHTISNIVDFYEVIERTEGNLIWDRSHLSTFAYGKNDGMLPYQVELLKNVHKSVLSNLTKLKEFEVHVVLLDRSEPLGQSDGSYHEEAISWQSLKKTYLDWFTSMEFLFTENEYHHIIDVDGCSKEEVYEMVKNFVF